METAVAEAFVTSGVVVEKAAEEQERERARRRVMEGWRRWWCKTRAIADAGGKK